jgi:serine/threonine protein kinase
VQGFYSGVVIWSSLHHPNVLSLLGVVVTEDRFVTVSEWMINGNINEFVKADINADRLKLVCFLFRVPTFICH